MDLKVGDVVKLKTGGPKMTVSRIGPYGAPDETDYLIKSEVQTTWFVIGDGGDDDWIGPYSDIFGMDALVKLEEPAAEAA